ncbi:MAG: hypothetical protein IID41_03040 [Planctomycetes bacterium]|nr:hypothetical protein [Planctomycetota bacterium]
MALTFYDDNAGGGDKKWTTSSSWSDDNVPLDTFEAILTDVRTSNAMLGETVTSATWPDKILITAYSGNIGDSGTHLVFDDAAGSETLDELRIERATGKIYLDFIQSAGSNTVIDTHVNVTGTASDQVNLGGAAAYTNIHLLRGRTNLGMTGTVSDLFVAHSTTSRDVFCNIASGATITNIRQGGGVIVSASTNNMTGIWVQSGGGTQLTGSATIDDYFIHAGNLRIDGSGSLLTITNLYIYGGIVDLTQTGNLRALTNVFVWPGGTLDLRHVETMITNTKIVTFGSARVLGNKQPTLSYT